MKTIVLTLFAFVAAVAQTTVPANFYGAGLGYQQSANPNSVSGWNEVCHNTSNVSVSGLTFPAYLCQANDFTVNSTSVRVDLNTVLVNQKWFSGGTKTGAGAAVNANGVGGSFALGGWAAADISKIIKVSGLRLVTSVTWQKDDVVTAVQGNSSNLGGLLKTLGSRAAFRFGFGRTF